MNMRVLALNRDGAKNQLADKVKVIFEPGRNLRFSLDYLGEFHLISLMQHVLDSPGASLREFIRIINMLDQSGKLNLTTLGETIQSWRCNELVKDALHARFQTMKGSGIFAEDKEEGVKMDSTIKSLLPGGGAIVISLKRASSLTKRMIVEIILSKSVAAAGEGSDTTDFSVCGRGSPLS